MSQQVNGGSTANASLRGSVASSSYGKQMAGMLTQQLKNAAAGLPSNASMPFKPQVQQAKRGGAQRS